MMGAMSSHVAAMLLVVLLASCAGGLGRGARSVPDPVGDAWLHEPLSEPIETLSQHAESGTATATELALLGFLSEALGRPGDASGWLARAVSAGVDGGTAEDLLAAEAAAYELGALEDWTPDWPDTVTRLGAALSGRGSTPRLAHQVRMLALRAAARRGDAAAVEDAIEAAGCLTRWRAVGPFGPRDLLSFDVVHPPARPGSLAEAYDLGSGRGSARPFDPRVERCDVELAAPGPQWGGTTYAVTSVETDRARPAVLTVETLVSARVWLNGELVMSRDRRREFLPIVHRVRLDLPRGTSTVVVALTSRYAAPVMTVTLTDPEGISVTTHGVDEVDGVDTVDSMANDVHQVHQVHVVHQFLEAHIALAEGDPERVRGLLAEGPEQLRDSVMGLLLEAGSWSADPTAPYDVAQNRALALLDRVGEREPAAWLPYLARARVHADEERYDEALSVVRQGLEAAPDHPALWALLANLLATLGLWQEVDSAIDRSAELAPGSYQPLQARLGVARGRGQVALAESAARALSSCDTTSAALSQVLLDAGRWSEAEAEVRRLIGAAGEQEPLMIALAEALHGRGAFDDEAVVLGRMLDRNAEDRTALLGLVDIHLARGRRDAAIAELERAVARVPADHLPERRLLADLGGAELLQAMRVDGRAAIAEYEASGVSYDVPSVLVLDRTVFRVFPDGSVVELTHNVTHVLTAEGIESEGELELSQGAVLLAARTITADGAALEPEEIEGKDTLSFPSLAEGDYIESEVLRGHEPPPEFPGGMWPWRFYFQGHRSAFHRSELVVVAPEEMDLDVSWRGEPLPVEEETAGGLRTLRWVARQRGTLPEEPDGPAEDELIPSVLVTSGATWEGLRDTLREALADRGRTSAELRDQVRRVLADASARSPEERVDALFRWVAENVEPGDDGLAPVSHVLAARTGDRTRLLATMVRAAGLDVELGFARSSWDDQTIDELPSLDMYSIPVFRAAGRWVHVADNARWTPSWFLPSDLRGQRVLMIDGSELFREVRDQPLVADRTEVRATLRLAGDGRASGEVVERRTGADAVAWRRSFASRAPDERVGHLEESYLADVLADAEVADLRFEGLDRPDEPLVVTYRVTGARIAEAAGPGLALRLPFLSDVAATFASLPERTTPLVVREPAAWVVEMAIELPPDHAIASQVPGAQIASSLGRFGQVVSERTDSSLLSIRRELDVRTGRVSPADYPAFAAFCREADRIEQHRVDIAPR